MVFLSREYFFNNRAISLLEMEILVSFVYMFPSVDMICKGDYS